MTATDTHTETDADDAVIGAATSGDGVYRLVASNDHKMVGRLWIGASILFLFGLAILGVLTNIERVDLGGEMLGSVTKYFQAWTLLRSGVIFMGVLPLFIGIATVIVPLQVGSASIAFPRLAAASFWAWLAGAGIHVASFLADGGLGAPVAGTTSTEAMLLSIVSLGFMIVALLAASVCIATTVVALRPAGMTLLRVPAFSWSMLVATSVWLFSLPVLIANLIYSYADMQGRPAIEFGDPELLWHRIEWAWSQPQVFAYAIPVLGIFADVVPVAAKHRQANRPVLLGFIGLFGVLSFGAWAQSFLSRGADPVFQQAADAADRGNLLYDEFLYIAFGLAIFVPVLATVGGVMDTIRRGSAPKPNGAVLGAVAGVLTLLVAVIIGEVRVVPLWDGLHIDNVLLSSSTAVLMAVVGASLAASVGALSYWAPKIFGGFAAQPPAMLAALCFLGGGVLVGAADLVSGLDGQPDISVVDNVSDLVGTMNVLAVVGAVLLVLGVLSAIAALLPAAMSSEVIADDPWDGHTLEWAAPSPPPVGNFIEPIDTVQSPEPLLDEFEEVS